MPLRVFVAVFISLFLLVPVAQSQTRTVPSSQPQMMLSFAPVVKKAAPAVVNIYTTKTVRQRLLGPMFDDPLFQELFGGGFPQGITRERMERSLGSGVIVKPDGTIVTSNHVIAGADEITVVLADRREFDAKLETSDEKSDLAVLKIDPKGEPLPFLEIKDSDDTEVGDLVLAIGNPFGVGQTVTSGIISALARTNLDITDINYFIQTDAAINPGNSGGALVTVDGKLIGINSAIYSRSGGNMGLGFAVPSNMVRVLLEGGKAGQRKLVRPWTGIEGQELTGEIAASLGLRRPVGVLVNALHPASPALKAGLKVGDVIASLNGRVVEDTAALTYRVATQNIGSEVNLEIIRQGEKKEIAFPLIAPPEVPARDEVMVRERSPLDGARIANLSPAVLEEIGLRTRTDNGVVVLDVQQNSAAARLGLGKGDLILAINARETKTVRDVLAQIKVPAQRWRIAVGRKGETVNLLIAR